MAFGSGSLSAEISARITEQAFFDLEAPVERVCSAEVPPMNTHDLEAESSESRQQLLAREALQPGHRAIVSL